MPQLSITSLILEASIFVKIIMIILLLALLSAVYIFGVKYIRFKRLKYKNKQFEKLFWSGSSINTLYQQLINKETEGLESQFVAGFTEFKQFNETDFTHSDNVIITNCRRAMSVASNIEIGKQEKGLSLLASIGSTSPYIGLLGTVYGIMNSFMSLGSVKSASINHVAPGIAEALIATAIGLLAAIPSVLAYNYFSTQTEQLITKYDAFTEEFTNVLQRQILRIKNQ